MGHGRSDGPRAQCSVDMETDFVVPVMEHVKYVTETIYTHRPPVYIVGHSMGGLITVLGGNSIAQK